MAKKFEQIELALLTTAEDSITAEVYENELTNNGIGVVVRNRTSYLPKYISFGYTKYVDIYVRADKLDEAKALLETLRGGQPGGDIAEAAEGASEADAAAGTDGEDGVIGADNAFEADAIADGTDNADGVDCADNALEADAVADSADGIDGASTGVLHDKKNAVGFIFLLLILILPTIVAIIAIINHIMNR